MFASKASKVLLIAVPTSVAALVSRQMFAECKEDTVTIRRQRREFAKYLGCFEDREENRNFKGYIQKSHKNTIESCCATCRDGGFVYAATAGIWCVCGNKYPDPKTNPKLPEERCCDTCSGNPKQKCGGNYVFSVFETGNEQYTFDKDGKQIGESFIPASPYDFWGHFKPKGSEHGWHD
ncbi:xylosyltransferase oxt-like [Culicoides brevitarsis]|uniref:xylosyltransferase oxt-like n=1 Tax=Culicoides brevitarsis TaxID=469753 RepID=UPI00307C231B